jgi:hypothetical protein
MVATLLAISDFFKPNAMSDADELLTKLAEFSHATLLTGAFALTSFQLWADAVVANMEIKRMVLVPIAIQRFKTFFKIVTPSFFVL